MCWFSPLVCCPLVFSSSSKFAHSWIFARDTWYRNSSKKNAYFRAGKKKQTTKPKQTKNQIPNKTKPPSSRTKGKKTNLKNLLEILNESWPELQAAAKHHSPETDRCFTTLAAVVLVDWSLRTAAFADCLEAEPLNTWISMQTSCLTSSCCSEEELGMEHRWQSGLNWIWALIKCVWLSNYMIIQT